MLTLLWQLKFSSFSGSVVNSNFVIKKRCLKTQNTITPTQFITFIKAVIQLANQQKKQLKRQRRAVYFQSLVSEVRASHCAVHSMWFGNHRMELCSIIFPDQEQSQLQCQRIPVNATIKPTLPLLHSYRTGQAFGVAVGVSVLLWFLITDDILLWALCSAGRFILSRLSILYARLNTSITPMTEIICSAHDNFHLSISTYSQLKQDFYFSI